MRSLIDTRTNKLYLLGPGDFDLSQCVPPGTREIQLQIAPSGHLLMECDKYAEFDQQDNLGGIAADPISLLVNKPQ